MGTLHLCVSPTATMLRTRSSVHPLCSPPAGNLCSLLCPSITPSVCLLFSNTYRYSHPDVIFFTIISSMKAVFNLCFYSNLPPILSALYPEIIPKIKQQNYDWFVDYRSQRGDDREQNKNKRTAEFCSAGLPRYTALDAVGWVQISLTSSHTYTLLSLKLYNYKYWCINSCVCMFRVLRRFCSCRSAGGSTLSSLLSANRTREIPASQIRSSSTNARTSSCVTFVSPVNHPVPLSKICHIYYSGWSSSLSGDWVKLFISYNSFHERWINRHPDLKSKPVSFVLILFE